MTDPSNQYNIDCICITQTKASCEGVGACRKTLGTVRVRDTQNTVGVCASKVR